MAITYHSSISLVLINIRKDRKNYIIEDITSNEFFEMPEVCIDAINLMDQGRQLGAIERELKEKYPNEEVDILDFAEQLLELKLIDKVDGVKVEKCQKNDKQKLGFLWISPKAGKLFFNKLTYLRYLLLFILILILFVSHPHLFPHHEDIFVFNIMVLNVIMWMTFTFLFVLFHEFGHILAMRAFNLPTRLEVGYRMLFVVLETDMSLAWKLEPKQRNVLYLAGLCFDTLLLFIALVFQLLFSNGHWLLIGLMNLAVFDIVLRMIFQCCVYMKTDMYYLLENVTGNYNLMENAKQIIRKRFTFLKIKTKEEVIFSEERKTLFLYTVLYSLGVVITIIMYFIYYIPEVIYAGKQLLPGYEEPVTSLAFWDAVLFSLQVGVFILLLLYSWKKKYSKK